LILVTGAGRCGSSLMMQTLHLLGVPLIGEPQYKVHEHCLWGGYHKDKADDIKITKEQDRRAKDFNPKGYWELDMYTLFAICHGEYKGTTKGHVVKLMGEFMLKVNSQEVEKVIICKRYDTVRQAESMYDLSRLDIEIADENKLDCPFTDVYRGMNMYDMQNKLGLHDFIIDKWAVDNEVPYIVIYFEDILDDPKETIENLVHFLDIDGVDINKAIDNVDER
jgi:hypothetical protein